MLPHVLMFLRGLYNSGMAIVLAIIIKFSEIEFAFSSNNFIFSKFLIPTLILFFANLFSMFVNYTFTPQHLSFLNLIFLLFYRISKHYSAVIIICEIIIDLFLIFSTLLFSEIVIINKWGLNNNTRKQLLINEQLELNNENRSSELIDEKKESE